MRFNDNNSCLHLLTDGLTVYNYRIGGRKDFTQQDTTTFGTSILGFFNALKASFANNIFYITDPFNKAFNKCSAKLSLVFDKEVISETGTFICKGMNGGMNTIFYSINTYIDDIGNWHITYSSFHFYKDKDLDKPVLHGFVSTHKGVDKSYLSDGCTEAGCTPVSMLADVLLLALFKKYCEVETKIIEPGKKIKHPTDKYLNETKSNITILDATWFTNIVSSGQFIVGDEDGFMRWQRYGPGLSDKKLIHIKPFVKEGYHRKAKVLLQEAS